MRQVNFFFILTIADMKTDRCADLIFHFFVRWCGRIQLELVVDYQKPHMIGISATCLFAIMDLRKFRFSQICSLLVKLNKNLREIAYCITYFFYKKLISCTNRRCFGHKYKKIIFIFN